MSTTPPFPPAPAAPHDAGREHLPGWLTLGLGPRVPGAQVRGPALQVALLAVLTALTLDLVRASGPLLDHAFSSGVVAAALTAVVTYALPGAFVGVLLLGTRSTRAPRVLVRRAVPAGVVALAVARIVLQLLGGEARFVGGLAAVALSIAVLTVAVAGVVEQAGSGALAAAGIAAGAGTSLAVQLTFGTWDALWRDDRVARAFVAILAAAAIVLAVAVARRAGRAPSDPPAPDPARRLWALGPFLSLEVMIIANAGFLASQSGRAVAEVGVTWLLPGVIVVVATSLAPSVAHAALRLSWMAALALPLAIAAVFALVARAPAPVITISLIVATVAAPLLLASALRPGETVHPPSHAPSSDSPALPRLGLALTASATGLGVILPLLLYQVDYDVPLGFPNSLVIVAAAAVLALAGLVRRPRAGAEKALRAHLEAVAVVAAVVVLLWAVPALAAPAPATPDASPRASTTSLRLLDWNLHYGVSAEPGVELEQIARVIESSDADVVTLQEVSRGWVMGGGAEMATWLSQRLDMGYVFAPAADTQFGNVILSRYSLTDVVVRSLPYGAGPQRRSAISATVLLADGTPVRVTSVHLQHRAENTPTRLQQLDALLAGPRPSGASVIAGDFNAEPGWPEIDRMTAAGYASAVDVVGDPAALTSPSDDPIERIDWVFGHGLEFSEVDVPDARQSDHLPVVVSLTPAAD